MKKDYLIKIFRIAIIIIVMAYVAGCGSSSKGYTAHTYTVGEWPSSIAIDGSGNVWVTNFYDSTVTKLSATGVTIGTYGTGFTPACIAIDSKDNVWITNQGSNTVTGNRIKSSRYHYKNLCSWPNPDRHSN